MKDTEDEVVQRVQLETADLMLMDTGQPARFQRKSVPTLFHCPVDLEGSSSSGCGAFNFPVFVFYSEGAFVINDVHATE